MKVFNRLTIGTFLSLVFVACGGGSDGGTTPAPVATLSVNIGEDKTINPNEKIVLDANIKNNSGAITYVWKEGSTVLAKTASLSYDHNVSGDHSIILTITDASSKTASDTVKITVRKLLSSNISLNNNTTGNIEVGASVSLTSTVQNDSGALTYSWSIDGVVQTGETTNTFSPTFATAGSYTVSVTVTDATGATAIGDTVITVLAPSNDNTPTTPTVTVDPLTKGLKAWYKFDGNSNDSSGNGNHGIDTNMTYITSAIGKGAKFDGSTSSILVKQSESLLTLKDKFTLSFWTKHYYTESGKVVVHITNGLDVPLNGEAGFYNYSSPTGIAFNIGKHGDSNNTASVGMHYDATEALVSQSETLVTFVVDGKKLSVYSNAEFQKSTDRNNTYPIARPSSNWYIGSMKSVYHLNGVIDDLRLYNRALSKAEIQKLYELKIN